MLLLVVSVPGTRSCLAAVQERPEDAQQEANEDVLLRVGITGTLTFDPESRALRKAHFLALEFRFFSEELESLSDPETRAELDLTAKQEALAANLADDSARIHADFRQRWIDAGQGLQAAMIREGGDLEREFRRRIDDFLLPHQQELLGRLVARERLAVLGVARWGGHPEICAQLDLDEHEMRAASDVAKPLLVEFNGRCQPLEGDLNACFLRVLDDRQKSLIGDLFPEPGESGQPSTQFELLLFRSCVSADERDGQMGSPGVLPLWRLFLAGRAFQMDRAGRLESRFSAPGFPAERFAEAILSPPLSDRIGIPGPVQPLLLKQWRMDREFILEEFAKELSALRDQAAKDPGSVERLVKVRDELAAETSSRLWDAAISGVPFESLQALNAEAIRTAIAQLGLLRAARWPEIREFLGLTREQQDLLESSTEGIHKSFRAAGWEMEARLKEALSGVLDAESNERMRRILDVPTDRFVPLPMVLVQASEGDDPAALRLNPGVPGGK